MCSVLLWIVSVQYTVRILGWSLAQNFLSCVIRKGQQDLSICSSSFRLATDCTTPKLLGSPGLIPVARWDGVSSMACFSLLPSLQAPCLFQKLGRTVMLPRGLCDAKRLPFLYFQFFCLVCSAVKVDPLYACCIVILFFFFLINW